MTEETTNVTEILPEKEKNKFVNKINAIRLAGAALAVAVVAGVVIKLKSEDDSPSEEEDVTVEIFEPTEIASN